MGDLGGKVEGSQVFHGDSWGIVFEFVSGSQNPKNNSFV